MKLIYIMPLLFMAVACNNRVVNNSSECKKYLQTIEESWPEKIDGYHQLTDYETILNKNKSCLLGKSKKKILSLFGEPDKVRPYNILYYLKKECTLPQGNQGGCAVLTFTFNEKDKVVAIPEPVIWQ